MLCFQQQSNTNSFFQSLTSSTNRHGNILLLVFVCLLGIHWLIMTIWIWIKGTDFGHGKVEKGLFRFVSGFIYIFVYLNVHDGPTRSRMTFYYCLLFLEDAVLFAVWIIYGKPPLSMKIGAAVLVFGGFLLGMIFFMVN